MKFGAFDGINDGEHSGVGLTEISRTFAVQDELSFGSEPFE